MGFLDYEGLKYWYSKILTRFTSINTKLQNLEDSSVTDTDLTTALAGYLKNSGEQKFNGVLTVGADSLARIILENAIRKGYFQIHDNGRCDLVLTDTDGSNLITVFGANADGTNAFNGTATGNLALDGGGTVNGAYTPLILNNKENTGGAAIGFQLLGELLGFFGISNAEKPIFIEKDGNTHHEILHTGNLADHALLNTGGTIDGAVKIAKTDGNYGLLSVANRDREVTLVVDALNNCELRDATNERGIIRSSSDGDNTFYGIATGNLPLDGGGTVKSTVSSVLSLECTDYDQNYLHFYGKSGRLGSFGFTEANKPVFSNSGYTDQYEIWHQGNSAKVAIQATPPTSTYNTLWVY